MRMTEEERKTVFTLDALRDALRQTQVENIAVIKNCIEVLGIGGLKIILDERLILSGYKKK